MKFIGIFGITLAVLTAITMITILVIFIHEESLTVDNTNPDAKEELFALSIIHFNDFHARFEEINAANLPCREGDKCIGGFARLKTVVDKLKVSRKNSILLNAGDNYQGTFWYSAMRYNVTAHFLNMLPTDATVLGNHEFAHRVKGLVPLLRMLKSPVVVANIDDRHEPSMQGLFKKSHIVERNGRKIGIIGVILRETSDIANTDGLRFTDEAEAIRNEATRVRQSGANIIVVLSHCGLTRDREIASETGDFVDVIVGGHSHSFLYTTRGDELPGPDKPVDTYPIVVTPKSNSNRKVLIVQAYAFTRYVGDLTVYFNAAGHVRFFQGNPLYLSADVEEDPVVVRELIPWREEAERQVRRVIGSSLVNLTNNRCRHEECAVGSFAADAFVYETQLEFPDVQVFASIIQAGGLRNSFLQGDITYGDVVTFMPFENTLDILQLKGDVLMEVFEHSVARSWSEEEFYGWSTLQVSGFRLTFNTSKPVGGRLQTIEIRAGPSGDFESINLHKLYSVIVPSFLSSGGDGFTMIKPSRESRRVGLLDTAVMERFIARNSPISFEADGRIVMLR